MFLLVFYKWIPGESIMTHTLNSDAGDTPLIHAARQGHTSIALYLLEHGTDAFVTPSENQPSALHHAAGTGLLLPLCSMFVRLC